MFSRILVATDDSKHSQRALNVAGNIASRFDAELIVLHVFSFAEMNEAKRHMAEVEHLVPPQRRASSSENNITGATDLPVVPIDDIENYGIIIYQAAEKIGEQIADRGAKIASKADATKVSSVVREGDPAEVILNVAKEKKIDLIVLGSRGLGTLKGLLMGSVSSKVNHLSDCCCMTVK